MRSVLRVGYVVVVEVVDMVVGALRYAITESVRYVRSYPWFFSP